MIQTIRKLAVAVIALAMGFQAAQAGEEGTKTAAEQLDSYATGWNVGVFGGASLFQSGHLDITSPAAPGVGTGVDTRSQLNGVAGAEGGYTWSGWKLGKGITALPAVDGEFFYTGSDYKATGSVAGVPDTLTANLDAYVFSIDPKLKFQFGRFRPYVGFGVGAAYLTADHGTATITGFGSAGLSGHTDDVVLALQGLAGMETFITKNWAIDVDYKFLDLVDPTFSASNVPAGAIPVHYQGHSLTEHLLTAGLKFYF